MSCGTSMGLFIRIEFHTRKWIQVCAGVWAPFTGSIPNATNSEISQCWNYSMSGIPQLGYAWCRNAETKRSKCRNVGNSCVSIYNITYLRTLKRKSGTVPQITPNQGTANTAAWFSKLVVVLPPSQQVGSFLREGWFQGRIGISYSFGGQERKGCKLRRFDGEAIYIIFVKHYHF